MSLTCLEERMALMDAATRAGMAWDRGDRDEAARAKAEADVAREALRTCLERKEVSHASLAVLS